MKLFYTLLFIASLATDDIPFKPKEEFDINLDFKFKVRASDHSQVYTSDNGGGNNSSGPLPYLHLDLHIVKLTPDEVRVRIQNNKDQVVISRKVVAGDVINLDMGYIDDIKGRVTEHEYTVYFLSKDKKRVSRIVIYFQEDGTFLVNGEKRGRV
ncbi:MAG TPA: hypothetical protein VIM75_08085 [Ohtaekwangia sp.]|uniref:hypothetical protein n=1 Tax=Ohtaekwangia sp. TaxID=2066019 RepID=UPI002F92050B